MNFKLLFLSLLFILISILFGFAQNISFVIETTEYKEGKESSKEITKVYFGMQDHMVVMQPIGEEDGEMRILYNKKEKTMIFLNDQDKSGMKMKMQDQNQYNYDYDTYEETVEDVPNFKKTGKTMSIQNYTCHEYIETIDNEHVSVWMTTELPVSYYQLFDFYGSGSHPMTREQNGKSSEHFLPFEFRKYGFPLKTIVKDNEGKIDVLEFKSISKSVDANKFKMDGYNIQDLSALPLMNNMNR